MSRAASSKPHPPPRPSSSLLKWAKSTELVGLRIDLMPTADSLLYPEYATALHAWFLDQVHQSDPDLSAILHDNQTEKNFTLSRLQGPVSSQGSRIQVIQNQTYPVYLTALSRPLVNWLSRWVKQPPAQLHLRHTTFQLTHLAIELPPQTYAKLSKTPPSPTVALHFLSPTSFRSRGHHLPLPIPRNLFHSYLRRWNTFTKQPIDPTAFLDWVDQEVVLLRHQLTSVKTVAGKRGSVTGFMGTVELGIANLTVSDHFNQLFATLGHYAAYCGTGHKTPFGLGVTRWGWQPHWPDLLPTPAELLLARRIEALTQVFKSQRKRQGKHRATHTAQLWATILARREIGDALSEIAEDLELPYSTTKTYCKLARRALRDG